MVGEKIAPEKLLGTAGSRYAARSDPVSLDACSLRYREAGGTLGYGTAVWSPVRNMRIGEFRLLAAAGKPRLLRLVIDLIELEGDTSVVSRALSKSLSRPPERRETTSNETFKDLVSNKVTYAAVAACQCER